MARPERKQTVWDKAKAYVEAEKGRKYDLEESWLALIDAWEYDMATAWDAGYKAGLRAARGKK